jgi:hypothetical protein
MIPYAFKHDVIDGRRHLGLGFVAQRLGMDHMGPFTFNGLRFLLGALPAAALVVAQVTPAAPACR